MFTGRVVGDGEPQFTAEDTDGAIALAEEEADTCPKCGMLRAWCRDPDNQFAFRVVEEQCHADYALAAHRGAVNKDRDDATRSAVAMFPAFRKGFEPDWKAGLDLPTDS